MTEDEAYILKKYTKVLLKGTHPHLFIKKTPFQVFFKNGGGGGIRTHGTLARSTVFKTAPINRSGTPPKQIYRIYQFYLLNFFCQYVYPIGGGCMYNGFNSDQ